MSEKKKFYEDGPTVPSSKKANQGSGLTVSLGNDIPKIVPTPTGQFSGAHHPSAPKAKVSHNFSRLEAQTNNHLRYSGHKNAHRIGHRGK